MEPQPLTARQQDVYDYLVACIDRGRAPTIRELGKAFGIASAAGVNCHLTALETKGYIRRDSTARGITIIGGETLFSVARDFCHAVDSELSDEEIQAAYDRLKGKVAEAAA